MIAVGPDRARLAALRENLVAAAIISPPADAVGKSMGFGILARGYEVFKFPFIGLSTTIRRIKEKPAEVTKIVKSLVRANRFIREDREGAVKILMNWGRVEHDYAAASYDATVQVFNMTGNIQDDGMHLVINREEIRLGSGRLLCRAAVELAQSYQSFFPG